MQSLASLFLEGDGSGPNVNHDPQHETGVNKLLLLSFQAILLYMGMTSIWFYLTAITASLVSIPGGSYQLEKKVST